MTTQTPALTRTQLVFGKEPAAWVGLVQAVLAAVVIFGLPLTTEQSGLIVAFVNAVLGAYLALKVRPIMVAAVVAVVQTALPLLVAFGLPLTDQQQGVLLTLTGVILTTFLVRPQATPVKYPADELVVEVESEVVAETPYDAPQADEDIVSRT